MALPQPRWQPGIVCLFARPIVIQANSSRPISLRTTTTTTIDQKNTNHRYTFVHPNQISTHLFWPNQKKTKHSIETSKALDTIDILPIIHMLQM